MKLRGTCLCGAAAVAAAVAAALAAAGFCFAGATARAGLAGYDAAARTVSGGATLLVEAVTRRPMRVERREAIALGGGSRKARRRGGDRGKRREPPPPNLKPFGQPATRRSGCRGIASRRWWPPPSESFLRASASAGASSSTRGRVPGYDGTLFLTNLFQPFTPNRLTQLVREYIDATDLGKRGSCHLLRHTCATLMLEGGADTRFIQQLLGHAELSTTQIYTPVSIQQLKQVHSATHPAKLERKQAGLSDGPRKGKV